MSDQDFLTLMVKKTCPCSVQRIFLEAKLKISLEKIDILNIFAQNNYDCGYTLELVAEKIRYTPANSSLRGYTLYGNVFLMLCQVTSLSKTH